MEKIELGKEVQDKITGFKGIAIARSTFLQGCSRILVQPKIDKEGKIPESMSFDEPDIEVISDGVLLKPKPKKEPPGGPRPMPFRAKEPTRRH